MADIRLQLSQLSYQDAADEERHPNSSSSSNTIEDTAEDEGEARPSCQLDSQAQTMEISSSNLKPESDDEPRSLVTSGVRLEPSSHSSHRLSRASYLLLARRIRSEP